MVNTDSNGDMEAEKLNINNSIAIKKRVQINDKFFRATGQKKFDSE